MIDGVQHSGPTDPEALRRADRLVLYVDPDEALRAATAAAITAADKGVDVAATATVERAQALLDAVGVDCLIVGDVDRPAFLRTVDAPVVLYTRRSPGAFDDAVLAAVDTFVERRETELSDFLAQKVLSLVEPDDGRTQDAMARALATAGVAEDQATHQFVVDDAGEVVWASAPFDRVFPVDRLDASLPDTDNFDDRLRALLADSPTALSTVVRTEGAAATDRVPFTIPTADGEAHFVHTGHRLPDELGGYRLEVFERVTATVNREARIELLEVLVEASKDGLYTLDREGNIEFYNATFAEMLGYDDDELIGRHASTVLVDGELKRGQARVAELIEDGDRNSARVDLTFLTKDNDPVEMEVHFTLLPAEDGAYDGLMGVARDISVRKQRERELQEYRKLVEAARDPMFVLDATGDITLFNESMADVVDAETLAGRSLTALFSPPEREQLAALLESLRTGESEWEQYELRLTGGETDRLYEATVGALWDDGDFAGTVGTLRDVTERNRRTDELDLLKQVLARVLRHNIRSQLTVIQSYAEGLAEGSADPTVAGEKILHSTDSLLGTAKKAREIERLVENDLERQRLDVARVADDAVERVAADHPEGSYDVEVPSVDVRAHPALETAVANAVENAVVHTDDGRVRLTAAVTEDSVELRISDDGEGIPDTDLASLEQRAETPLQHTSGAGLWLIDWIVGRSGGDLTLDSDADGTTVRMRLDRAAVDTIS